MTTEKQLKANRTNALKGGVKSADGKKITRFNALKHGVLRELITEYEEDFYRAVLGELIEECNPKNIIEQILVERIAVAYLRLYRVAKAEAEFMQTILYPKITEDTFDLDLGITVVQEGYKPTLRDWNVERLLAVYSRYETSIENRMYKAISTLSKLKSGN